MAKKPFEDIRMIEILDVVQQLAMGNFTARAHVSGKNDDIDAIIAGLNMLAEELEARKTEIKES
ncbi:MAG: hypothetical protein KKH83_05890 [Candidatus Margulisbacteria bacterium]|nr:hypothetical protein [Candidatus Margulisiibacteriota bacterium]